MKKRGNANITEYGHSTRFTSETARQAQLKSAASRKANNRRLHQLEAELHLIYGIMSNAQEDLPELLSEALKAGVNPVDTIQSLQDYEKHKRELCRISG